MTSATKAVSQTLWLWPTGLFPRRVMYYLKAKRLPRSILRTTSNPDGILHIVRVRLDMQAGGFVPVVTGEEERPAGCSLPVLRVSGSGSPTGADPVFVRQSASLLQYLEESYPSTGPDLSGGALGLEGRAAVRDITQLVDEVCTWTGVDFRHTNEATLAFSGLTKEQMSEAAGLNARREWKALLAKLERWVRKDVVDRGSLSLAGVMDTPTLADFALAAPVEYFREMFGFDLLEGCDVLKVWHKRFVESEFFVGREQLERVEKDGFEELFIQ